MGLKLCLTDDDKMAVFLQEIILQESKLGNQVNCFYNGLELLNFLDNDVETGDDYLVFLDINMPMMGGIEFLEHLSGKPYSEKVMVALVSSYSPEADEEARAKFKQIIHVYEKPITPEACEYITALLPTKRNGLA
jgi:CheY-like chemotaxis protein